MHQVHGISPHFCHLQRIGSKARCGARRSGSLYPYVPVEHFAAASKLVCGCSEPQRSIFDILADQRQVSRRNQQCLPLLLSYPLAYIPLGRIGA